MKKTGTFFLMGMYFLLLTFFAQQVNGQVSISAHNTSVNTNFNGWNGTMPNGFARSSNNNYMGTAPMITGGVYAIPNMGFGYQPSSNTSANTTSVTGTYVNNTGGTITELKITYDAFKIEHRDARIPCWNVNVSSGVFGTNLNWCSNQANATKTFSSPVSIASGATFTITFNSDRGSGSQSSPMIGFNNIKVESVQAACVTPEAPVTEPQFFCGGATVNDLFADGMDIKWYDAEDATTPLTLDAILETGNYYATQTINNCESDKIAVEVTVNPMLDAPMADAQIFCGMNTIAELVAEGTDLNWYDSESSTTPLTPETVLETQTYYVSQSANGCESPRTPVEITVNEIPTAPEAQDQSFCGESTIFDLVAEGTDISWYDTETSTDVLTAETSLETKTYYVSQIVNGCESIRIPVEITVNEIPTAPVAEAQAFCGTATIADLVAEGTNLSWFDAIDSTEALTIETELVSGTYYVEQSANDCVSERTAVEVTVNEIPAAPTAEAQVFCGITAVADLIAEGTNLSWYDAIDATTPLTEETELTSATYYVAQSVNDCISERTAVEITINEIPAAPAAETQAFCGAATVADLVAEGANLSWYDAIDATTPLTEETELTSATYYVEQSTNDCVSERTAVAVSINEIPAIPEAQDQSFCGEATVADLVAEGTNLAWYESLEATTPLTPETALENGTYYVSQSSDTCESVRIPIEVAVNEIPAAPIAVTLQVFEPGDTLADLEVEGENLTWYDEDGNILDPTTPLVDGEVYYVTQTVNGCESEKIAIETETLSINESNFANFSFYPNPVKNILYISNKKQIENVLVFDLSGQLIMEKKTNAKSVQLDLSQLSSATYVIKVVSDNQIKTIKVIRK